MMDDFRRFIAREEGFGASVESQRGREFKTAKGKGIESAAGLRYSGGVGSTAKSPRMNGRVHGLPDQPLSDFALVETVT